MAFFSNRADCYLIAEIGVNHAGNVDLAKEMVFAAKQAGADAVKFQTFTADALVTKNTPKVKYQESTTSPQESHYEMIRSLEFRREDHGSVLSYCAELGIDFISTPYDIDSARFLDELGVGIYKVASADIVDLPLHEFLAGTGKPVIISTGMATLGEVDTVVDIYRRAENMDICLLHCVSNYPCSDDSLNLRAMVTLERTFGVPVGFSDHSVGPLAAALSVALGAVVVEKHFTLDKSMAGPDHKASSNPSEFADLVHSVRRSETILGSAIKACQEEERQMSSVSRKSIVAARMIPAGTVIQYNDLSLKRPGTGLQACHLKSIVGQRASRDIQADALLSWYDVREDA